MRARLTTAAPLAQSTSVALSIEKAGAANQPNIKTIQKVADVCRDVC